MDGANADSAKFQTLKSLTVKLRTGMTSNSNQYRAEHG